MDALENIILRNSARVLSLPIPSEEQMKKIYLAALRAPDHAWLRPWKFIEIRGDSRKKLSDSFIKASISLGEEMTQELEEKLLFLQEPHFQVVHWGEM